jgi:hypothetical protein
MKPTTFSSRQLALMVRIATLFDPEFMRGSLSQSQIRLTCCGRMTPKPAVLARFNAQEVPGGYQWQPR